MELKDNRIQVTEVFQKLSEASLVFVDKDGNLHTGNQSGEYKQKYNIYILEGGSRSSKTISIIQFWLLYAQTNRGRKRRVVISRKKGTWIKTTVLFDFINLLMAYGWYNSNDFNKSDRIYKLFDTEFWFIGLDDEQKLHGMTTDAFWINETIEATLNDFDQLEMRCSGFGIIDYNPTEEEHWIYDNICKRDDAILIHSTMLDNPFLPENMRRKILSYKPTENNYKAGTANKNKWEIYGLGKRAKVEGLVFPYFEIIEQIPNQVVKRFTGLDFGFTNSFTAIVEVGFWENNIYINELCYKTHMFSSEIIATLKVVNNNRKVVSESADPRLVAEIYNAGFNIHAAKKPPGSKLARIDMIQTMKICVTEQSLNVINELKNYTYTQDKMGKWLNEPIKDFDHALDATGYVVYNELLGKHKPNDIKKLARVFH